MTTTRYAEVLLATALALIVACGDGGAGPDPGNPLAGGVLATFSVQGEEFRVWVTRAETIEEILALEAGESEANIPNGPILRGPGQGSHNEPWSWHLDAREVEMAELTVEVCDGRPSFVEENVDDFVEDVGRYCPWAAELVGVEDHR